MIEFEASDITTSLPRISIKVIGVGGAGGNMVNSAMADPSTGIEFIAVNTDAQALNISKAHHTIQLGVKSTRGLGSGANPDLGRRAAEEDLDKILELLDGSQVVFLAGGLGGGTGSGALPVIARAIKDKNVLLIAVVTTPFIFEGRRRAKIAEQSLALLKESVDTLIVIPNQKILDVVDQSASMIQAFEMVNEVLTQSIKNIADIIDKTGLINVDFADVRSVMKDMGLAVMATGRASGEDRARQAALKAIHSPLLENMSIAGARGVVLNVKGNAQLGIHEISAAASIIYEQVNEEASIILGSVIDESCGDEIEVTLIATGFEQPVKEDIQVKPTVLDRSKPMLTQELAASSEQNVSMRAQPETPATNNLDIPAYLRKLQTTKNY